MKHCVFHLSHKYFVKGYTQSHLSQTGNSLDNVVHLLQNNSYESIQSSIVKG